MNMTNEKKKEIEKERINLGSWESVMDSAILINKSACLFCLKYKDRGTKIEEEIMAEHIKGKGMMYIYTCKINVVV